MDEKTMAIQDAVLLVMLSEPRERAPNSAVEEDISEKVLRRGVEGVGRG